MLLSLYFETYHTIPILLIGITCQLLKTILATSQAGVLIKQPSFEPNGHDFFTNEVIDNDMIAKIRHKENLSLRFKNEFNSLNKGTYITLKKCTTCNLLRPPRTSHCSVCDCCVEKFDHHCPFIGQCIGKNNYRLFLMYNFALSVLVLYAIFVLIFICITKVGLSNYWWLAGIVLFILCMGVYGFFIIGLFVNHVFLVLYDLTTHEYIKQFYTFKNKLRYANLHELLTYSFKKKFDAQDFHDFNRDYYPRVYLNIYEAWGLSLDGKLQVRQAVQHYNNTYEKTDAQVREELEGYLDKATSNETVDPSSSSNALYQMKADSKAEQELRKLFACSLIEHVNLVNRGSDQRNSFRVTTRQIFKSQSNVVKIEEPKPNKSEVSLNLVDIQLHFEMPKNENVIMIDANSAPRNYRNDIVAVEADQDSIEKTPETIQPDMNNYKKNYKYSGELTEDRPSGAMTKGFSFNDLELGTFKVEISHNKASVNSEVDDDVDVHSIYSQRTATLTNDWDNEMLKDNATNKNEVVYKNESVINNNNNIENAQDNEGDEVAKPKKYSLKDKYGNKQEKKIVHYEETVYIKETPEEDNPEDQMFFEKVQQLKEDLIGINTRLASYIHATGSAKKLFDEANEIIGQVYQSYIQINKNQEPDPNRDTLLKFFEEKINQIKNIVSTLETKYGGDFLDDLLFSNNETEQKEKQQQDTATNEPNFTPEISLENKHEKVDEIKLMINNLKNAQESPIEMPTDKFNELKKGNENENETSEGESNKIDEYIENTPNLPNNSKEDVNNIKSLINTMKKGKDENILDELQNEEPETETNKIIDLHNNKQEVDDIKKIINNLKKHDIKENGESELYNHQTDEKMVVSKKINENDHIQQLSDLSKSDINDLKNHINQLKENGVEDK